MTHMECSFALQVPSSTKNLALIREFVSSVGQQAGLEPPDVAKLELAVDEACANVIEHAYGSDVTKEVSVRASFDSDSVQIVVIDRGQGFDPNSIPQAELEKLITARKSGGLGMRLMKKLMDEVHYQIIPGEKNELTMIKKIKK